MTTLNEYRLSYKPKPISRLEMSRRMGCAYNTYTKHEHNPNAPIYLKMAAWCVVHNIDVT